MDINWTIVWLNTKKLYLQRLQKKPYWSKNQCYKLLIECHDDAAMEVADKFLKQK